MPFAVFGDDCCMIITATFIAYLGGILNKSPIAAFSTDLLIEAFYQLVGRFASTHIAPK